MRNLPGSMVCSSYRSVDDDIEWRVTQDNDHEDDDDENMPQCRNEETLCSPQRNVRLVRCVWVTIPVWGVLIPFHPRLISLLSARLGWMYIYIYIDIQYMHIQYMACWLPSCFIVVDVVVPKIQTNSQDEIGPFAFHESPTRLTSHSQRRCTFVSKSRFYVKIIDFLHPSFACGFARIMYGEYPLIHAVLCRRISLIELFADNRACVWIPSQSSRTHSCTQFAIQPKTVYFVLVYYTHTNSYCLHKSLSNGLHTFVQRFTSPNQPDEDGARHTQKKYNTQTMNTIKKLFDVVSHALPCTPWRQ